MKSSKTNLKKIRDFKLIKFQRHLLFTCQLQTYSSVCSLSKQQTQSTVGVAAAARNV